MPIEIIMIRRGENRRLTEPLLRYLESVFSADITAIDKCTPASANEEIIREVKEMPGMSQVWTSIPLIWQLV